MEDQKSPKQATSETTEVSQDTVVERSGDTVVPSGSSPAYSAKPVNRYQVEQRSKRQALTVSDPAFKGRLAAHHLTGWVLGIVPGFVMMLVGKAVGFTAAIVTVSLVWIVCIGAIPWITEGVDALSRTKPATTILGREEYLFSGLMLGAMLGVGLLVLRFVM